jgi:hypothetical protein
MVTVYSRSAVHPYLSVAAIVKVKLPAAVGVPERTPSAERSSPLGKLPVDFAKVYGLYPPPAVIGLLYGWPIPPLESVVGATVIVRQTVLTVYWRSPVQPYLSVASIVKVKLPAGAVGIPDNLPPVESINPLGRSPLDSEKLYGLLPPLAVMVVSYARPTLRPVGRVAGFNVIVGQPAMVMVYCRSPVQPWLSVATIVKVKLPAAVGVPERTPSAERANPLGKLPVDFAKVYGPPPPLAVIGLLYGWPIAPFESVDEVKVIVGQKAKAVVLVALPHAFSTVTRDVTIPSGTVASI